MKKLATSILCFIAFALSAGGQIILNGIVTDSLNKPVPYASVYLSKTTIGTLTSDDGSYSLIVPHPGVYELIASSTGYTPYSRIIRADRNNQAIDISLKVNYKLLDEVTINSRRRNRAVDYSLFINLFFGKTGNAERCRIKNPEDLHLISDDQTGILRGFSAKPLQIENKALGYVVFYDLTDFNYNRETGNLRFSGSNYFKLMEGNATAISKWNQNRLRAYYGSKLHFLRALYSESLEKENFHIYSKRDFDPDENRLVFSGPVRPGDLRVPGKNDGISFYGKGPVLISYTDEHPELAQGLLGFQTQEYVSALIFADTMDLYPNGYYYGPYSVAWDGKMADDRIADMLPFDFHPGDGDAETPDPEPNLSPIGEFLKYQRSSESNDRVFVHLDRNKYRAGDTLFFKAYIQDKFTGGFATGSTLLYALLFNKKHILVDSSRFKIENSSAAGWMCIPDTVRQGILHFSAFTGRMQNFDPSEAFQTDIIVARQVSMPHRVEIRFNREHYRVSDTLEATVRFTDTKGEPEGGLKFRCSTVRENLILESYETQTNSKGEAFIRLGLPDTFSKWPRLQISTEKRSGKEPFLKKTDIPFDDKELDLAFLPEGGTLVSGLVQRIGFSATNSGGEPVRIEGLVKTKGGLIIDTIRSGLYGPGVFSCIPEPGMYVELLKGYGNRSFWPLPEPSWSGLSLRVNPSGIRSFSVDVQANSYNGDTITISGTMNLVQIFSTRVAFDKRQRIIVDTDPLSQGVAQVTVFDKNLVPLAERLVYVNRDRHLRFSISAGQDTCNSLSETELRVTVADDQNRPVKGIFSISVIDSAYGYTPTLFTPGIDYTFNYHPYFLNSLPASVLQKGLENISSDECDLLLMVYGWSRYKWDFSRKAENGSICRDYEQLKLKILYALKSRSDQRKLDLVSLEGPSVMHLLTNKEGEVSVPLDSLPEITRSVTVMPDPRDRNRVQGALLSIPYNEKYFKSSSLVSFSQDLADRVSLYSASQDVQPGGKIIEMPDVVIRGERNKVYHDIYEEEYQFAAVRSLDYKDLWTSATVKDALYRLCSPYKSTDDYIIIRPPTSMFGGGVPALVVLDGMPIYDRGWSQVRQLPGNDLTSLTVIKGPQGYARYGEAAKGGIIFVNTMSSDPAHMKIRTQWELQQKKDDMLLPVRIYRVYKEFYCPTKADADLNPDFQNRAAIVWKSDVYYDGTTPATIKYLNNGHPGPVLITINGISEDNLVGTGRGRYIVK